MNKGYFLVPSKIIEAADKPGINGTFIRVTIPENKIAYFTEGDIVYDDFTCGTHELMIRRINKDLNLLELVLVNPRSTDYIVDLRYMRVPIYLKNRYLSSDVTSTMIEISDNKLPTQEVKYEPVVTTGDGVWE